VLVSCRRTHCLVNLPVCAVLAASLLAAGCQATAPNAGDLAVATKSSDQLFKEARSGLASATFVREKDEFQRNGVHESITKTTDARGGVAGVWRVGSGSYEFVQMGKNEWDRPDRAYLANAGRNDTYAQKVLPGHWEVVKNVRPYVRGAITIEGGDLFNTLNGERTDLQKGTIGFTNGVRAVVLSDATADIYVSVARPARFVRAVWRLQQANGVSGMVTDFSYPSRLNIAPPADFYDPEDPATLPARHRSTRVDSGPCDASACRLVAGVTNDYGKSVGQSTLTFHITDPANAEVASCSAPVPAIPHAGSQDVSCSVGGASWATYVNGRGAGQTFRYEPTIHDPLWDD
jgi:hypothetical protein